jgi:Tfp pilus assembly protein PilF
VDSPIDTKQEGYFDCSAVKHRSIYDLPFPLAVFLIVAKGGLVQTFILVLTLLVVLPARTLSAQSGPNSSPYSLSVPIDPPLAKTQTEGSNDTISQLVRQKQWNELSAITEREISNNQADASTYYWLGFARFHIHDPIGAIRSLRTAAKFGVNSASMHETLGLAYYDLNQYVLFEKQMKIASLLDPKDFAPKYLVGIYLLSAKSDVNGALAQFSEALSLSPNDSKILYEEGYCLELLGDSAKAREFYVRSIGAAEANRKLFGWPYEGMARLLLDGDPQRALPFALKAVELEPNEYSHHLTLAKVYSELANLTGAIAEAKSAEALNPNYAPIRYVLFRLYRRSGDLRNAEGELQIFHKLNAVFSPD